MREHPRKFFWFSLFTKRTVPYSSQRPFTHYPSQCEENAGKRYGSIRLQKNEFCNMTVKKQETEVITPVSEALDDELRFVMVQI